MNKAITRSCLIALVLFNVYGTQCSELKTFDSKPKNHYKSGNFFETAEKKITAHSQRMMNTTTYTYGSFDHVRDLAVLSVLPTSISQAILSRQRNNMLNFLEKNEENALEGVKNHWGFDAAAWSKILENNKKEHEFNLSEMRKKTNCGTAYHDVSLPTTWLEGVQHECSRYSFNADNFNLGTTDSMNALAYIIEKKRHASGAYNPTDICFNPHYAFRSPESIHYSATHELTHVLKGHSLLRTNIAMGAAEKIRSDIAEYTEQNKPSFFTFINPYYSTKEYTEKFAQFAENKIQQLDLYNNSPEKLALIAAQEKTADTYVACTDPSVAKNIPDVIRDSGYIDNHNDMKVIHANWQATQAVENSQKLRRIMGSACGQQECTIV